MIHFLLKKAQEENGIRIDRIEDKVWEFLMNYDYPGNVRELKNTLDRMVVLLSLIHIFHHADLFVVNTSINFCFDFILTNVIYSQSQLDSC